jgi:SAM-dependent methyltransferase
MTDPRRRYESELAQKVRVWGQKPLLRQIYAAHCARIREIIDHHRAGPVIEIGSGIGSLHSAIPGSIATDFIFAPWLDIVCDGYRLPFRSGRVSALILFDVFHHLEAPVAFLSEAKRVLTHGGIVLLFEPYVSVTTLPIYGLLHSEHLRWRSPIDARDTPPTATNYHSAQAIATRMFFGRDQSELLDGWSVVHREVVASFSYLLSGGFSHSAVYPRVLLPGLQRIDRLLSRWPRLFGARCLIVLSPSPNEQRDS